MTAPGKPRRRPPWWPQDEEWPPRDWSGARGWSRPTHWRRGRGRPPLMFRLGCALLVFAILASVAVNVVVWVVATILGHSSAPPGAFVVAIGVVAGALIAGSVATRGVRRMSAPLEDLANAAERIERGDYSVRVPEGGPLRLRSLVRAFNQMSARLGTVDETRRAFLADAAHELRTPLSIISGQLEAIEVGVYPADAGHLAPVHEQIAVLEQLIDDMRTVALAEAGALALNLQPTDVGAAIDHAVAAFGPQATAKGVTLSADFAAAPPRAAADEQRLAQVLTNLLSNAIRHTPTGGTVIVSAKRATAATELQVAVADSGSGIPPDVLPHVFDRFFKEAGSTGSGLGLAICRDLVEAQHGRIAIESSASGTIVTFTLPLV